MEPQSGKRDNSGATNAETKVARQDGLLESAGRLVGFFFFAIPAMVIFAGLILLPIYKHYKQTQYKLACEQVLVKERNVTKKYRGRMIKLAAKDPVFTTRLMMNQTGMKPVGEQVVNDPSLGPSSPTTVNLVKFPPPPPPQGRLYRLAKRVDDTTTKRGLLLVAIGSLIAALFLFSPPHAKKT